MKWQRNFLLSILFYVKNLRNNEEAKFFILSHRLVIQIPVFLTFISDSQRRGLAVLP
jgi:hypothetical protein